MLTLTKLRDLDLAAPPGPGRRPHLSAASGLVCTPSRIYVIADDELALGVFPASGEAPGELVPLFPGALRGNPALADMTQVELRPTTGSYARQHEAGADR